MPVELSEGCSVRGRKWGKGALRMRSQSGGCACLVGLCCLTCARVSTLCRAQGRELKGATEGILCIKQAWPAAIRTIKGDHERFEQTYFSTYKARLSANAVLVT